MEVFQGLEDFAGGAGRGDTEWGVSAEEDVVGAVVVEGQSEGRRVAQDGRVNVEAAEGRGLLGGQDAVDPSGKEGSHGACVVDDDLQRWIEVENFSLNQLEHGVAQFILPAENDIVVGLAGVKNRVQEQGNPVLSRGLENGLEFRIGDTLSQRPGENLGADQGIRGWDALDNFDRRVHIIHRQHGNSLEKTVVIFHDINDFFVAFLAELGRLVGTDKVLRQDVNRGNNLVAVVRQKFVAQVGLGQVAVLDEGRLIGNLRGNCQHFLEKLRRQDMSKNIDGFHKNSSLLVDNFWVNCVHYSCG